MASPMLTYSLVHQILTDEVTRDACKQIFEFDLGQEMQFKGKEAKLCAEFVPTGQYKSRMLLQQNDYHYERRKYERENIRFVLKRSKR